MKIAQILMLILATIGFAMARTLDREQYSSEPRDELVDDARGAISLEARKHKPFHHLFLLERKSGFSSVYVKPLHGIAFMGGLQSLVTFALIKIKIVVVTVTVIGFILLALKLFSVLKYTGYFYKNDYPPIGPPPQAFPGYPAPFPEYSSSPHDHDNYGHDSPYPDHYGRSSKDDNDTASSPQYPESLNMTEMMYSLMNVDKEDCQARLICELELMLSRSPFFNYLPRNDITRQEQTGIKDRSEECKVLYTKCLGSTRKRFTRQRRKRALRSDRA